MSVPYSISGMVYAMNGTFSETIKDGQISEELWDELQNHFLQIVFTIKHLEKLNESETI